MLKFFYNTTISLEMRIWVFLYAGVIFWNWNKCCSAGQMRMSQGAVPWLLWIELWWFSTWPIPETIVVDPPRAGCGPKVIASITKYFWFTWYYIIWYVEWNMDTLDQTSNGIEFLPKVWSNFIVTVSISRGWLISG